MKKKVIKGLPKRITAFVMAILMFLSLMPIDPSVFLAAKTTYTFVVKDANENVIEDAEFTFYKGEEVVDLGETEVTYDETAGKYSLAIDNEGFDSFSVSSEGYVASTKIAITEESTYTITLETTSDSETKISISGQVSILNGNLSSTYEGVKLTLCDKDKNEIMEDDTVITAEFTETGAFTFSSVAVGKQYCIKVSHENNRYATKYVDVNLVDATEDVTGVSIGIVRNPQVSMSFKQNVERYVYINTNGLSVKTFDAPIITGLMEGAVEGESYTITYKSSKEDYAIVGKDDETKPYVTAIGTAEGEQSTIVTITATLTGAGYETATATFDVIVKQKEDVDDFSFGILGGENEDRFEMFYTEDENESLIDPDIRLPEGMDGEVTLEITSLEGEDTDVATLLDGKIKIHKAGSVRVTATLAEGDEYAETVISFILAVKPAQMSDDVNITFNENWDSESGVLNFDYANDLVKDFAATIQNMDGATLSYKVLGEDGNPTDIAAFETNENESLLTVNKAGTVKVIITASKENYQDKEFEYTVHINKIDSGFKFDTTVENYKDTFYNGEYFFNNYVFTKPGFKVNAGVDLSDATITYDVTYSNDEVTDLISVDADGNVTFNELKQVDGTLTITIKASITGLDNYLDASAEYTITIKDWTIDDASTLVEITGTKLSPDSEWYTTVDEENPIKVRLLDTAKYKIYATAPNKEDLEEEAGVIHITSMEESTNNKASFYVYDTETGYVSSLCTVEGIKVDKSTPSVSIKQEELTFIQKLLYFFKGEEAQTEFSVEVSEEPKISAITKYYYISNSAAVMSEAEYKALEDEKWIEITEETEIKIPENAQSVIYAKVEDEAGHVAYAHTNGLISDNQAPSITLTPSEIPDAQKGYYKEDFTVSIDVSEQENLSGMKEIVYWIGEQTGEGTVLETFVVADDTPVGDLIYTHREDISISVEDYNTEAGVTVYVQAVDNAGNVSEIKEATYKVCKETPEISVGYDNDNAKNTVDSIRYYDADRTATITILSRTDVFAPANVVVKVDGNTVTNSWDDETQSIKVEFTSNGKHILEVTYTNAIGDVAESYTETFWIDKDAPTGTASLVEVENTIWDTILETLTFGIWKKPTVHVKATATDATTSVTMQYFVSHENRILTTTELEAVEWNSYTEEISLSDENIYIVYFKLTDLVGHVEYISTNGFVIDNTNPGITLSPEAANAFGFYNDDVRVGVSVKDLANIAGIDITSGIKSITYKVTCDGEQTQTGTLYTFDKTNPSKNDLDAAGEFTGAFTVEVDEEKNNSSNVVVSVYVEDNAGNIADPVSCTLNINATAPKVEISYDNNEANGNDADGYFFDAIRIATVTITDRADTFNAAATDAIKVALKNKAGLEVENGIVISSWTPDENDTSKHTATVEFTKDGYYTLEIDYSNKADLSNNKVTTYAEDTVAPFAFVMDKEAPINVSISAPIFEEIWDEFLEIITFKWYENEDVTLTMSAEDVTSEVVIEYLIADEGMTREQLDAITTWQAYDTENGLTVTQEQKMLVYVKATDQAGNVTYVNSEGIIIDKTKATITLEADTDKIHAGNVEVGVVVNDADVSSGIASVKYTVMSDGNVTQSGTLDSTSGTILVDASKNNSKDVVVTVDVVDNAGNESTESCTLSINTTAPIVDINYDNNTCLADNGKYFFDAVRTATITITDRADCFNAEEATKAIEVILKDKAGKTVSDNGVVITGWDTKGDTHTATVEFTKDGYYTVDVNYKNKAGLSNENITPESTVIAPFEFVIDTKDPVNVSVSALDTVWDTFLEIITFGLYSKDDVEFIITGEDVTSDVILEYYIANDGENKKVTDLKEVEWTKYTEPVTISKEQQMAVYVRVTDQAGRSVYVNSNGIVLDKTPAGIELTPEVPNGNGYYNSDVDVAITVDDSSITSGIQKVEYWITCDGKETKRETLYVFDNKNPAKDDLKQTFESIITVDAEANNSKDVVVTVEVTDNAGNVKTETAALKINSTAPTVEISYDNNKYTGHAGERYFFDALRTATITITDRADTFDAKAATEAIKVVLKDKAGNTAEENGIIILGWTTDKDDTSVHRATVAFTKDGYYTVDVDYTNTADMSNADVTAEAGTEAAFAFVIDTTKPVNVSVSALANIWKELLKKLTFGLYTNKDVELTINGEDVTSDVVYEYYIANDGKAKTETELEQISDEDWMTYTQKVTISKEQQMSVYVRVTDQAGNRVYVNTDGIVLDKTEAGIVLTPEAANSNGYYNSDVDVEIKVDDNSITSGIQKVEYWITSDGKETKRETLYVFDNKNPAKDDLKQTFESIITVDAEANNSKDVVVTVEVTDNAGNVKTETAALKINITAPTVEISYDNNRYTGHAGERYFFDALRTATITITDRADTFDAKAATEAIQVILKDKAGQQAEENGIVISGWTTDKDDTSVHRATVAFTKDGYYTVDVDYTNTADMSNADVTAVQGTQAPFAFVIDTTAPVNVSVSALANIWKELLKKLTFGLYTNKDVELIIAGEDVTSAVVLEYYIANDGQAKGVTELEQISDEDWMTYTQKVTISKEQQMSVYVRVTDEAGNRVYVNTDGIVLDKTEAGIVLTPEAPNSNGYYNRDVDVEIKVDDSSITSGIQKVEYWITSEGKETERKTLYLFDNKNPAKDELKQIFEEVITVDAEANNSKDVVVTVEVTDNAGNVKTETAALKINSTAPTVEISYDNNKYTGHAGERYFFDALRTATITITDRADTFDAKAATEAIKVVLKDKAGNTAEENGIIISGWTTDKDDTSVHTATVAFTKDGYYTVDVDYTNIADMSNTDVTAVQGTEAAFAFVIDTTDPVNVSVSALANIWKELLEIITFGLYTNEDVEFTVTGDDVTSDVVYEYYIANDGKAKTETELEQIPDEEWITYTQKVTIDEEQQMSVYVRVTDQAGNRVYVNTNGIVLDKTEAGIVLTPEAPNKNGIYNNDVDITITVDDSAITAGIKSVEYWITKDDVETKRETLYVFDKTNPTKDELKQTYTGTITVDAMTNNSSNVKVTVEVIDNAGNVNQNFVNLDIDMTVPTIEVRYDNNSPVDVLGGNGYFDASRTATIIVRERTNHFDKEAFANGVVITAKNFANENLETAIPVVEYVGTTEGVTEDAATHTFKVLFSVDANYEFAINYTDKADWACTDEEVNYGESVTPQKFVVDTTAPTARITVGELGFWEVLLQSFTFGLWSPSEVDVTITAEDTNSPVKSIEYYKTSIFAPKSETELKAVEDWVSGDKFTVSTDEIFVVYAKITDQSGNIRFISSNGIIVDETKPVFETISPEITITPERPLNGIYDGDVRVDVSVIDPIIGSSSAYAGLREISYEIHNMGTKTQEGRLFYFSEENPSKDELVQSWNGQDIIVDASKNNSNDVVVTVIATDNAGNQTIASTSIKIDTTKPVVEVSYDNNNGDATFADSVYYNASRIATIKVTERNFDPNAVNVVITNTDGTIPTISGWTTIVGTGNEDNSVHTATIVYSTDGDYTTEISVKDKAGNANENVDYGNSQAPTSFTIDKTVPIISLAYDNNDFANGNYYKADRTATISILEHNFDASRVVVTITATDNGQSVNVPVISNWSKSGDTYSATVSYTADALYTFDITYSDKAQNEAADFAQQSFYVDKTMPQMSITEIVDQSANNGDKIGFVITATDTNFDVFTPVLTAVIKTENGFTTKELDIASISDIANGRVYTISNIDTDGIYRITCTLIDKAGNAYNAITLHQADGTPYVTERTAEDTLLSFSVNRDGSAFEVDEATQEVLDNYYVYDVKEDIVIIEVNANQLTSNTISLNGKELVESTDYTIVTEGGNGTWLRYSYILNKELFVEEGEYTIVVSSVDEAENNAFSDVKNTKVAFVVDRTAPVVTISGLETKGRYQTDAQTVTLIPTDDGGAVKSIVVNQVDADGNVMKPLLEELSGDALEETLETNDGQISFVIPSGSYDYIEIVCTDFSVSDTNSGNIVEILIEDVLITENEFALIWATYQYVIIGGGAAAVAVPTGIVLFRRRLKLKVK